MGSVRGDERIPLNLPALGEDEIQAASQAIREGAIGGAGPYGRQVEEHLRVFTQSPHAFFVTSCTHAIELALMALKIGPGDDVVMPSFAFTSTATAVLRQGAQPVFAEIDPDSWTLDPGDVARCLSPSTRVIMPVHYGGNVAPMKELMAILPPSCVVIEDAAHALGASYLGQAAGTLGDAGCYSFHATKNFTCGEGGALVVRDPDVARAAETMREKGTNRQAFLRGEVVRYAWEAEGSSFVASDLLAAILLEQLKKTDAIQTARRAGWHRYEEGLAPLARRGVLALPVISPGVQSSYHIFAILVTPQRRDVIQAALFERGIETAGHYVPLHSSAYWRRLRGDRQRPLPTTDRVSRSILRLPLYPALTAEQQDRIIEALFECLPD